MQPVMFQSPGPTNPIQQQVLSAHHFTLYNHIGGALFLTLKFIKFNKNVQDSSRNFTICIRNFYLPPKKNAVFLGTGSGSGSCFSRQ
jgi:hypothetical protein